ncbi:DoxX family protein [Sulfitobacter guttiformis]|uniref:Putative oxidoreductase n=1 Tax=Sulfitobacter guttiformis TaxID=74349 RepID=A0A420DIC8_9RHOB|nr:DoxX family protein [Sulfitobacter guttiformis]KIN72261.1 DoxD-like family protein [Sulfitobacter guttiformis KCTC 32187]RKE93971.1 putative oxidoreductase [Sulfitobacter guttiformis]
MKAVSQGDPFARWFDRLGRFLIALLFLLGAVQKIVDPVPVMVMLEGVYMPAWTVWPIAFFNLAAGILLIIGYKLRVLAFVLAVYCMLTSYFHFIPSDGWQMSIFVKNWAIAGGLLILASQQRPAIRP